MENEFRGSEGAGYGEQNKMHLEGAGLFHGSCCSALSWLYLGKLISRVCFRLKCHFNARVLCPDLRQEGDCPESPINSNAQRGKKVRALNYPLASLKLCGDTLDAKVLFKNSLHATIQIKKKLRCCITCK